MAQSRSSQDSDSGKTRSTASGAASRSANSKTSKNETAAKGVGAAAASKSKPKPTKARSKSPQAAPAKSAARKAAKPVAKKASRAPKAKGTRAAHPHAEASTEAPTREIETRRAKPRTAAQRDAAFDTLVRNACLKAGTAAAISSLTRRVPLLGRLAPTLLGPLAETVALAQVQKALVAGVIELYEVELSDPEQRGVVLLATATNIGAQQLSKRSMEAILKQFGDGLVRGIASRVLPVASILAEITAAVASTYTVGKRAQALCKLPGTGAGNLADLLRGLSGIDQARLLNWSGEAFRLALMPFKSVLGLLWR